MLFFWGGRGGGVRQPIFSTSNSDYSIQVLFFFLPPTTSPNLTASKLGAKNKEEDSSICSYLSFYMQEPERRDCIPGILEHATDICSASRASHFWKVFKFLLQKHLRLNLTWIGLTSIKKPPQPVFQWGKQVKRKASNRVFKNVFILCGGASPHLPPPQTNRDRYTQLHTHTSACSSRKGSLKYERWSKEKHASRQRRKKTPQKHKNKTETTVFLPLVRLKSS